MKLRRLVSALLPVAILAAAVPCVAAEESSSKNGPYVTVYHDDVLAFQVRRDRIARLEGDAYRVWLRWLWAEPRTWKTQDEAARVLFADVACEPLRIRDLAILHKNRDGEIFDAEEMSPESSPWKTFEEGSGAAAAMKRLCEFLPELAKAAKANQRK
ncbi:MAG: hypothetical protein ACRD2J_03460 [Thermoanaerobaculia bacterium]